jgi:3-mercaptopyruvate sulfurtransferase SseA
MKSKNRKIKTLTTEELLEQISRPEVQIIDVRTADAYNGWKFNDEPRGGHIKGARSLPAKWINYIDWIEIIQSKGVSPARPVIVYGEENGEAKKVARQFIKAGYTEVMIYSFFTKEWTTNKELPMERLSGYRQLVPPRWLKELIDTGAAAEYDNDRYVICHAHYQNRNAYEQGHIPGAIEVDTNLLETPETWNCRTPGELKEALRNLGIDRDTTVILYGRFDFPDTSDPFPGSSAGHLGAMRCAFIMLYAGVTDVKILNGGLQAWVDSSYKLTTRETAPVPVNDFGGRIPAHSELVVDIEEAKEILKAADKNLVSVRSWSEFIGQVSGYNYIEKKGRIPGAVFGNCGSDAYHMENYRNLDHTTREYHKIEKMWKEAGITPNKHNSFYCGTGWRASEAFFNAWLMGWTDISVFDGGWYQWSSDSANRYGTGVPGDVAGVKPRTEEK